MAKIKFNSSAVVGAQKYVNSAKTTSSSVKNGVDSIRKNMQSNVAARSNISARLNNLKSSMSTIETNLDAIYKVVDSATTKYRTTESDVVKLGQAVVNGNKTSSKNSKNKGAFAPVKVDKTKKTNALKKNFVSRSNLLLMQEASKVKWGSKNNITQKCNPTSKYFNVPGAEKYTASKYDLSNSIFVSQGLINPKMEPSEYNGLFKDINPKLHPTTSNAQGATAEKSEGLDINILDLLTGVGGKIGLTGANVGGTISAVKDIYDGYKSGETSDVYKGILGIGGNFISTVGDLAENGFKADVDWKEMLIGNWKKGSALTEIGEKTAKYADDVAVKALFKSEMDGFLPSTAKNVGENLKVGAQWLGVVVSGVTNGISNYDDYKAGEMSAGRAVAETITETAVDVVIGAGAVAAVGAGIAALGISAPAVAVGAVAAGVVWGADALTHLITKEVLGEEKGLTELVSDVALDVGKEVLKSGKEMVESGIETVKGVGKAISNVGNAIGAKWRECFG